MNNRIRNQNSNLAHQQLQPSTLMVTRHPNGSVTYEPVQPSEPVPNYAPDFLPWVLAGVGVLLLAMAGAYALGYYSGRSAAQIVTVPTRPVCTVEESHSWLWGTQRTERCR